MQNEPDPAWPRFVRTEEAARLLDLSPRTLEKHRCGGTGPVYRKLGGRVVYTIADLRAWIEGSARQSTSEMAKASGKPDRAFGETAGTGR
ncbi:helix-turn-helix domain-containing protein [Paracoccus sp. MA]|uniref:helix-turn-helix transcriptional regulator n=1 Tax=Paracoccus sp. MA TaxID=2895796 RepID=UPI001E3798CD|nr:helix-turn-helix domain-containing protein [Paracoccus sp. MA]UFM64084.1 helix-turn-helix domain-containing protein [Paracoccus sp. MA]